MQRLSLRFLLAAAAATVLLSIGSPPPDSRPAVPSFHFGITTLSAEDCPAEFQNCDGEGPLSAPEPPGGGGGGGGQVRRNGCNYHSHTECWGSGCNDVAAAGYATEVYIC